MARELRFERSTDRLARAASMAALAALASGCAAPTADRDAEQREPVIYGTDDRREYYQLDDPALRALVDRTSVVLTPRAAVTPAGDAVHLEGPSWRAQAQLCADVPFGDYPVVGYCSGLLVAPDLVLTAGHCLE